MHAIVDVPDGSEPRRPTRGPLPDRVGDQEDQAFDAACGASGGACAPLWTMSPDNRASANFATVADDSVFVSGADGNLHVSRIGGSATCCAFAGPAPEARNSFGYLAFYTFVVGGIGSRLSGLPPCRPPRLH